MFVPWQIMSVPWQIMSIPWQIMSVPWQMMSVPLQSITFHAHLALSRAELLLWMHGQALLETKVKLFLAQNNVTFVSGKK